jgi:hypothetical protein
VAENAMSAYVVVEANVRDIEPRDGRDKLDGPLSLGRLDIIRPVVYHSDNLAYLRPHRPKASEIDLTRSTEVEDRLSYPVTCK